MAHDGAPVSVSTAGLAPGPVSGRRDRNRQRTRRALSEAALRLVAEQGYDRVTVDMIAEAADVSPRTFSNYFAGKDDAILSLEREPADIFAAALAAQGPELPLVDALRAALGLVAADMAEDPEHTRLRMRAVHSEPRLRGALMARFAAVEAVVTTWIATRLNVNATVDRRPRLLAGFMGAVMRASLDHRRDHDPLADLPTLVTEGFDLLLRTLTAPISSLPAAAPSPIAREDPC